MNDYTFIRRIYTIGRQQFCTVIVPNGQRARETGFTIRGKHQAFSVQVGETREQTDLRGLFGSQKQISTQTAQLYLIPVRTHKHGRTADTDTVTVQE